MSDNIIEVRNLGKKYIINHQRERYTMLRDVITRKVRNIGKRKLETGEREEFWALKDVSFDIKQGDRIGIIGRNGAGKSTLLKLLSRITEPTTGSIGINGRVASLLEVGTGFHPELTGRENIYLNGAILGMSKQEIRNKFDEIVEFAEVEKFLDTPVKRYSSGMYVRLAFSVAAHLEPEILIVDEVLAVGDVQFQKKCLGRMKKVGNEGKTVLFVSHNLAFIQSLCNKGLVLHEGKNMYEGTSEESIYFYSNTNVYTPISIKDIKKRMGNGNAIASNLTILNCRGENTNSIGMGEKFTVELEVEGNLKNAIVGVIIGNIYFKQLLRAYSYESYNEVINISGKSIIRIEFDELPLVQGAYNIHLWIGNIGEVADYVEDAMEIIVEPRDIFFTGKILDPEGNKVFCKHQWEIIN